MVSPPRDHSLDTLLDLDGQVLFVDDKARFWVKFEARRVEPDAERPYGVRYSLTLHDARGVRLVGFDNAHPGGGERRGSVADHRDRGATIRPYHYLDAATLLADFWAEVERVLRERGVMK